MKVIHNFTNKTINRFIAVFLSVAIVSGMLAPLQKAAAAPSGLPSGFSATTLVNYNMTAPSSVRVAPDGRIFVFDLTGYIKIFKTGQGFNATNFGSVSVDATGDRGLLGATFDRDFANNPYVYIHYVGTDDKVRIGRFNASTDVGSGFTVLYTAPDASGFQHAGGGITMGPDFRIHFGIGDSGTPTNSQDLTKVHGKIHRINRDGTVPTNPFAGQANVANTIYAYGLRNPFRITTDSATGAMYVGDVGYNSWEEINLLSSGKNYGWATQEGPCSGPCAFENPVYWYSHQFGTNNTNDSSITAGPVYRGSVYPASYQGKMFISDYVQGFMRTISPNVTSSSFSTFSTSNGSVVDMDVGPDGKLYFVTITSPTLYRLDYNGSGGGNAAPVAQSAANITSGPAPLTVQFSSAGSSDPEGQPLSYNWNFGDGTTSTSANPSKTFNTVGEYTVSLSVGDGVNVTPALPLTIEVGTPPVVTISSPLSTTLFKGGDTITYAATARDSNNNPINSANIRTTIILHHSDHTHPFMGPLIGNGGQFTMPKTGELSPDVWYRINVEATDSFGVVGSSFVEIHPQISEITVNTNPAGLNVILDGSNHVIPPTVQGVVGMTRQIAAPSPQMLSGQQYVFDHWSDNGAQDHTLDFPATATTYTAHYVPATTVNYENKALNPSFEDLTSGLPSNWAASKWGLNDAIYTSETDAHTGARSAKMQINTFTTGEDRLYHTPIDVSPGTQYNVRYFYKSNVQTKAVADVTLTDGSHKYIWLGMNQPSIGSDWREQNWSFTAPVNASRVVVNLYLVSTGYLQVDDFNLLAPTAGPPAQTAPVIALSASPTTIVSGGTSMLNWSVTGTSPTCTGSDGWNGTIASSGSQSVAPSATTTYTLTCTNGMGSDTKSAVVTVQPDTPPDTNNIVPNPSFEEDDINHLPVDWMNSKWGTNNALFSLEHGTAFDQDHHVKILTTSYTNGEAQWYFTPQTVSPNTSYDFAMQYRAAGPTKIMATVLLSDNSRKYFWFGSLNSANAWANFQKSFTTPANAVSVTVGAYLTGIGQLEIDALSLVPTGGSNPTGTAPVVTITASPTTVLPGGTSTISWSTTGTSPTCTQSGGWNGAIAASGTQIVTPTATTTYTISCSNGLGTDSKSVQVSVNDIPVITPTPASLIQNHSMVTAFSPAAPQYWFSGQWGTNDTTFRYDTTGRTDTQSIGITVSNYVSGDAKWFFEPVTVTAGTNYTFYNWYKSTAQTEMLAEYTLANGTKSYQWLGFVPVSAEWAKTNYTLTAPVNATKVTVMHILKTNGAIQLDDYSLTAN